MKTKARGKSRNRLAACAALLCALAASLCFAAAPAGAEENDTAELRELWQGVPQIHGPSDPEKYPFEVNLGWRQTLRQVNEKEIDVVYPEEVVAFSIKAPLEHASDGARVPTSISLGEGDVVVVTVAHREGNPAAGGAPFEYPILEGEGWEGGYRTITFELNEPTPTQTPSPATPPPPAPEPPTPTCKVPSLPGLGLGAAKAKLRAADCAIGQVRLARGATKGKGKVVKQFRPAGTQLAAGAPVAVKLGAR